MSARSIARWVERQNRRVDGGAVVLIAQSVFGETRWRVSVEMVTDHRPFNVANDYDLRRVLRDAAQFFDDRSDRHGVFRVAPYLESDEYARWCGWIE